MPTPLHANFGSSLPEDLLESVFQSRIEEAARWHGWSLGYHTLRSKGSRAGWPDLVLGRPQRVSLDSARRPLPLPELAGAPLLLIAELKSTRGKGGATSAQMDWLEHLHACGIMVALWYPVDWPEILEVLAGRATPTWPPKRGVPTRRL